VTSVETILGLLEENADREQLEGMERYAIVTDKRMGVSIPDLRKIARRIGKDHQLAVHLWKTGIAEARILASMVDEPLQVTEQQMDEWVADFNSWDICDQVCMNLFGESRYIRAKINDWAVREAEFEKRAAYASIAVLAWRDKSATDESFLEFLPLILSGAEDSRNFVKKAVSWALGNIGKRSPSLRIAVLEFVPRLEAMDIKPAVWIARQTVRDLNSQATMRRMAKMAEREVK
jgi:3-methyladenine DNA glycosylase AlkD